MTAQIGEILKYEGERYSMCSEPLGDFFGTAGRFPEFASTNTACWRGYVGEWEVIDARLYLVDLGGDLDDGTKATIESVFPGYPDRVFAHWYSGIVRVPQGRLLEYAHMGYESTYERDLLLTFEKGTLIKKAVRENGVSNSESTVEGYGIGGMTCLPRDIDPGEPE